MILFKKCLILILTLEDSFELVQSLILNCRKMNANETNEANGFEFDKISNTGNLLIEWFKYLICFVYFIILLHCVQY